MQSNRRMIVETRNESGKLVGLELFSFGYNLIPLVFYKRKLPVEVSAEPE